MEFALGCNYWDSAHGTEMWRDYDEGVVERDISVLAGLGVRYMRVFPNWRDFQPVRRLYRWRMKPDECVTTDGEKPLPDVTGVSPVMISRFRHFAGVCDKYGIKLTVSIVTGWMSGRMFLPEVIDGRDPVTDPEALVWTARYIKGFVRGVKDLPNIIAWDLGNECNCLGHITSSYQAYVWTAYVVNAIKAEDPTRPVCSGMHGLEEDGEVSWTIADQGELTDYVTTHPYISTSLNNDIDPPTSMRSTIYPTAQSVYYSDLSGKPVIMQEQNAFCDTTANPDDAALFMRVNICSCLANGIKGHYWWCGEEHVKLEYPPYAWTMMERSLGLVDVEQKPKPVGLMISEMSRRIEALPFKEIPDRVRDAVCVVSVMDDGEWDNASAAFVLAKQAGLDVRFCRADRAGETPPDAPLYLVPGAAQWGVMHKYMWDFLKERVSAGASMLLSYDGGSLIELESVFGIRGGGCLQSGATHTARFPFGELTYTTRFELLIEPRGAEVLARNETGNPVFTRFAYGKGEVYFLNFPLEKSLAHVCGAYNGTDWYKIYSIAGEKALAARPVRTGNPGVGVTIHPESDGGLIVCAVNYTDRPRDPSLIVAPGWEVTPVAGDLHSIPACDGAFYTARRVR